MKTSKVTALCVAILLSANFGFSAPAKENWDNSCAKCHGEDGKGQTKVGKKMGVKDYTDAKSLEKFTDAALVDATIKGVIVDGKEKMKAFPEITQSEAVELVAFIRAMAKK